MDGVSFAAIVGLLALVIVGQIAVWFVLVQLIQQQGRILVRLDGLQHQPHASSTDLLPVIPGPPQSPPGLPVGTPIGEFRLPDLAGRLIGPDAWRGMRTLLVHWSTGCGFCDLIAPDLGRLDSDLRVRNVRLVLVSNGEPATNRRLAEEYGLSCPILLQPETEPISAFRELGTPVAYLLDEIGRVAEPLVAGADPVLALARRLAAPASDARRSLPGERPLSESHIERNGLKAGTLAPAFSLSDIHGQTVTLASHRGRRVLLVFTDPHCGPCDALAPDLAQFARTGPEHGLDVVVVGRGDPDENRRKAAQFDLTCSIALQQRWEVSKAYGIFATPVGYLIDEHGVIVRDVAMGSDAIVALAKEGLSVFSEKERPSERAVR
jgi:peroxiredoxin